MTQTPASAGKGAQPLRSASDRAEVFISYSRRAPGDRPDLDSDPRAAGRWLTRTVARDMIGVLEQAVAAAGYQAWRDQPCIRAGDPFANKIDAALLSCAGAVVLLNRDALERSSWVRWESAILTWRERIGMPVRVVPVLIGVEPGRLRKHGHEPSRLDRTQAHAIDPAGLNPDSPAYLGELERHARQIVEALGELEVEPAGPISAWINRIAACLPADCDSWRPSLEPVLPRGERLRLSAQPARIVARELLAAERDSVERIVNAFYGFPFNDTSTLKLNLQPVWVAANSATRIAEAKDRQPGKRIIAVNATEPGTGADVVRRALPRASNRQRLEWAITSVTPEDAVREVMRAIREKWGDEPERVVKNLGGCFVMLSCRGIPSAVLAQIVGSLAHAYPSLTYVVMVGDAYPAQYQRLEPSLPQNADEKARSFDAMLDDLLMLR